MDNPYQSPETPTPGFEADDEDVARPASVTVFGILDLVFGILGMLCTPFALVVLVIPQQPGAPPNPVATIIKESPVYAKGFVVQTVVSVLTSVLLTTTGVGLLKMRGWGRTLSNAYVVVYFLSLISMTAFNYFFLYAPLFENARKANDPMATWLANIQFYSGIGGTVVGSIFPVLMAIFINRRVVVDALRRADALRDRARY